METQLNTAPPQRRGCSYIAALLLAFASLLIGILLGAGALYGYIYSDTSEALTELGIQSPGVSTTAVSRALDSDVVPQCEPCPECEPGTQPGSGAYGLVYPIEESLTIKGSLQPKALQEVVVKNRYEFQACYQKRLQEKPDLKGEMSVQFTVSPSGPVIAAIEREDTVGDAELRRCILDEIRNWSFKKKSGPKQSIVRFDVIFAPLAGTP